MPTRTSCGLPARSAYQTDDPGTTQVEAESRALYKTDAATNAIISYLPYDIVTWGLMNSNDGVGNVAVTFGKATATWVAVLLGSLRGSRHRQPAARSRPAPSTSADSLAG